MPGDKRHTLSDAISRYVHSGQTVALEGFGHLVPAAAGYEIIRQRLSGLTLARMSCDAIVDQLLAAGCVARLVSSFVANTSAGSLYELRRRMEAPANGTFALEEYSHGGMIGRYIAGASRLPFYPIKSYRGSDLPALNPRIKAVADPYGAGDIYVVPPLNPDVTIIHAQRADTRGNVQAWGILGVQQEAAFAARTVIATVEEIVDDDVVRAEPNRTIVPSHAVTAVVHCPRGAHPSSVQNYYERDDAFYRNWSTLARDPAAVQSWLRTNVWGTSTHEELLARLGVEPQPC